MPHLMNLALSNHLAIPVDGGVVRDSDRAIDGTDYLESVDLICRANA